VTAYGWVVVAAAIVLGFVLPFIKNRTVNARANSSGEVSQ